MKRPRLGRNARVGSYRILEFAGKTEAHSLYTATKGDPNEVFWLLEASQPLERVAGPRSEAFQHKDHHYLAFQVEGTSAASLARLVGAADWKFLVPRWAALAEQVGRLHSTGRFLQQDSSLQLDNVLFNNRAQFLPLTYTNSLAGPTAFRAPEPGRGTATSASDVFVLGAALLYLLGGGSPEIASLKNRLASALPVSPKGLTKTLAKATDPDPAKRFRDAGALADALSATSPRARPAQARPARGVARRLRLVLLCFDLLLAIALFFLVFRQGPAIFGGLLSALTPMPTRVPTAMPSGELALDVLSMDVTPDRVGHIEVRFTRGGKPIAQETTAEFTVTLSGIAVPRVEVTKYFSQVGDGLEYRYRLDFDTSPLITTTGTFFILARMIGTDLSGSIYYGKPSESK